MSSAAAAAAAAPGPDAGVRLSSMLTTPFLVGVCAVVNGFLGLSYYALSMMVLK